MPELTKRTGEEESQKSESKIPSLKELTPREIVAELDAHIVGQDDAKKAVAVAVRNRWRRRQLPESLRNEISPKNILMIGPTGVGKTELARRLAKLTHAPFVKVEATKYTEVGYYGRDVESMIRELVENAINLLRSQELEKVKAQAEAQVEEKLLDLLVPLSQNTMDTDVGVNISQDGSLEGMKDEEKPDFEIFSDDLPEEFLNNFPFGRMNDSGEESGKNTESEKDVEGAEDAEDEKNMENGIIEQLCSDGKSGEDKVNEVFGKCKEDKKCEEDGESEEDEESSEIKSGTIRHLLPFAQNEKERNSGMRFREFLKHDPRLGGTERQSAKLPPHRLDALRKTLRKELRAGLLEEQEVQIPTRKKSAPPFMMMGVTGSDSMESGLSEMLDRMLPHKTIRRTVSVREARRILTETECESLLDEEKIQAAAIALAENSGIIFLDEIDKIVASNSTHGADVSRQGVQRDLLPIVEGTTVQTRYGYIRTDHILFIAAGAFHQNKPGDLMPELQGRFPIRVELHDLTRDDFRRILSEPQNALLLQYQALLATENVQVEFGDDAIEELADYAWKVNQNSQNIGARRLYTILERLLEDVSFEATEMTGQTIHVDAEYVRQRLETITQDDDLSRFIL